MKTPFQSLRRAARRSEPVGRPFQAVPSEGITHEWSVRVHREVGLRSGTGRNARPTGMVFLATRLAMAMALLVLAHGIVSAQAPVPSNRPSTVAPVEGKYTFLVFYKQNDAATQAMTADLKSGMAKRKEVATAAFIRVDDPAQKELVTKYGVSRAPLPLLVAVAPNGAMTGMFQKKIPAEGLDGVFVTPTMMVTMKALQAGKIVLVTVAGSVPAIAPPAVNAFLSDPHFKDRLATVSMTAADPLEAKFIAQMQIASNVVETQTVLLAPPGVLVGKFNATTTKDIIAAALAKAGKCCDDPNCKHHPPPQSATKAPAVPK